MKKSSTFVLRAAVVLMGLIALLICGLMLPDLIKGDVDEFTFLGIGIYVSAIPFWFALFQTLKLLDYIDKEKAFSRLSIKALSKVKYCALVISGLYIAYSPLVMSAAQEEDAPGLFALGLVIIGASFVVATSAGVLQALVQSAVAIKAENDLTV